MWITGRDGCDDFHDLIPGHIADGGGIDLMSTAEQSIVRRASMLELQMEMLETRFADNDGVATAEQLLLYQRTANSTRRLLELVGLRRRPKDITGLSLGEVLREGIRRDREAADAELEAD